MHVILSNHRDAAIRSNKYISYHYIYSITPLESRNLCFFSGKLQHVPTSQLLPLNYVCLQSTLCHCDTLKEECIVRAEKSTPC